MYDKTKSESLWTLCLDIQIGIRVQNIFNVQAGELNLDLIGELLLVMGNFPDSPKETLVGFTTMQLAFR